jgi:hypothetical protein
VAALTDLPRLRALDLPEFANITNRALNDVAEKTKLERLRLASLGLITDEGVLSLAKCRSLHYLSVEQCPRVTQDAIAALRADLPSCEVLYK